MTSSVEKKPGYSRRFFWFALAIVAAVAAYTGAWHYAAGILTDRVNASVASLNRDGRRASCENAEVRGYPFRIGVFCRSVMYEDAKGGLGLRARAFRSAAQVYQPHRALAELEGPATLEAPGLTALDLDWSSLRASARLASPLPDLLSIESRDLTVRLDEPGDVSPLLLAAELFELHMRPAGDDLDIAARFSRLTPDPALVGLAQPPAFNGLVDFRLSDGAVANDGGPGLRGRSGLLRAATLSIDGSEAGVTLRGPLSVDAAGLIDAELEMTLRDPRPLADLLIELMPEAAREIELSLTGIAAMGEAPTLPLRIFRGEIRLGFFSLGTIPPL